MAPPNIPGDVMPVCSWHFASFLKRLFARHKQHPKAIKRAIHPSLLQHFKELTWSDPDCRLPSIEKALGENAEIRSSLNTYRGKITNEALKKAMGFTMMG